MMHLLIGLISSAAVAITAYRKHALSAGGSVAAVVVGTVLVTTAHPFWFALMLVFFVTSSAWSRYKRKLKRQVAQQFAKGERRDALQVLANGGAAVLFACMYIQWNDPVWVWAFTGSLASVTADTWATEIGVLSSARPRSVLNGRKVDTGESGGVTLAGTLAAAAGAALIAVCGYVLSPLDDVAMPPRWHYIFAGTAAGLIGAFVDSLLGATVQRQCVCHVCQKTVESLSHCGRKASPVRGVSWMTNDAVNAIASFSGGVACIFLMG